jgi:hypothetical protein
MGNDAETTKKREELKGVYKSPNWAKKVDGMKDTQVVAIYLNLKAQKKL